MEWGGVGWSRCVVVMDYVFEESLSVCVREGVRDASFITYSAKTPSHTFH